LAYMERVWRVDSKPLSDLEKRTLRERRLALHLPLVLSTETSTGPHSDRIRYAMLLAVAPRVCFKQKHPKSPYFFFLDEFRPVVKRDNPGLGARELSTLLSSRWVELSEEAKTRYKKLSRDWDPCDRKRVALCVLNTPPPLDKWCKRTDVNELRMEMLAFTSQNCGDVYDNLDSALTAILERPPYAKTELWRLALAASANDAHKAQHLTFDKLQEHAALNNFLPFTIDQTQTEALR